MQRKRDIELSVAFLAGCVLATLWWSQVQQRVGNRPIDTVSVAYASYVDERQCAECHSDRVDRHQSSGHADTIRTSGDNAIAQEIVGKVFVDAERNLSYQYLLAGNGDLAVSLSGDEPFPLEHTLGSGQNAISFLTLLPDGRGDTVGIEHRVSMYRGDDGWELDLTPGHQGAIAHQEVELFGKIIRGDTLTGCIGCHTTTAEISNHQLADVRPNVGCQSCHGPGREHVTAMQDGTFHDEQPGYSGLSKQTAAQEIELCGKCHRLPSDKPDAHLSPNIIQNVRFQPAGLIQSKCYTASDDLRCSTCHDPHATVSRDRADYVRRCLDCHGGSESTHCPVSPQEKCIECHMPAIDVHRGIEFHDHWIRVRQDQPAEPLVPAEAKQIPDEAKED